MPSNSSQPIIDFSKYIADRTLDFAGRDWVFAEIEQWLTNPDAPHYFIITGEPGIGKTAIAARLTQISNLSAAHFCIARRAETIDPFSFVRSLSHQLTHCDVFAQHILAPADIHVSATIDIRKNYGPVIGVHIENLIVNAPSAAVAFNRTVLDPLKQLYQDGFDRQLVILVDALDEAVQHQGSESIINLLADAQELPSQVRFVLTSRPDSAALRHFEGLPIQYLELNASQDKNLQDSGKDASPSKNLKDVREYVCHRVAIRETLRTRLIEQGISLPIFIDCVVAASTGNFLYLIWLLPAIERGTQRLDTLDALPEGLDGIYREFLRTRTVGRDVGKWRIYRPVLGVLAAAQDLLNTEQLVRFTQLSAQEVDDVLLDVQQFLDPTQAHDKRYQLYHQSFADFLGSKEKAKEFWIDLEYSHRRIADYYWDRYADFWRDCDEYSLHYLSSHLRLGCEHERLFTLVDSPRWRKAQSSTAYLFDLRQALMAARAMNTGKTQPGRKGRYPLLGREVRYALAIASLHSLSRNMPPALLHALVQSCQRSSSWALEAAQQHPDPLARCRAIIALAPELEETERKTALEDALKTARLIEDAHDWAETTAAIAPHLSQSRRDAVLQELRTVANHDQNPGAKSSALAALVPFLPESERLTLLGEAQTSMLAAKDAYDRARAVAALIPRLEGNHLPAVQSALAFAWAIEDELIRGKAVAALTLCLAKTGFPRMAVCNAQSIGCRPIRAEALAALATHLAERGQQREVFAIASSIQPDYAYCRAQALAALVPFLPGRWKLDWLRSALVGALKSANSLLKYEHVLPVPKLSKSRLSMPRREDVLQLAQKSAEAIGDKPDRTRMLAMLIPRSIVRGCIGAALLATRAVALACLRPAILALVLLILMLITLSLNEWAIRTGVARVASVRLVRSLVNELSTPMFIDPEHPASEATRSLKSLMVLADPMVLEFLIIAGLTLLVLWRVASFMGLSWRMLLKALIGYSPLVLGLVLWWGLETKGLLVALVVVLLLLIAWRTRRTRRKWIWLVLLIWVVSVKLSPLTFAMALEIPGLLAGLMVLARAAGWMAGVFTPADAMKRARIDNLSELIVQAWEGTLGGLALLIWIAAVSVTSALPGPRVPTGSMTFLVLAALTFWLELLFLRAIFNSIERSAVLHELFVMVWAGGGTSDRARLWASLILRIVEAMRTRWEQMACAVKIRYNRLKISAKYASTSQQLVELLQKELPRALDIDDRSDRARELARLLPYLMCLACQCPNKACAHLYDIIDAAADRGRGRQDLLSDLRQMWPVMVNLGGPRTARDVIRAIRDTARQWP